MSEKPEYDENDSIIIKTKVVDGQKVPDCDHMLKVYLNCVQDKPGLTHVDFCFEESEAYKQCITMERDLGLNRKLRPKNT